MESTNTRTNRLTCTRIIQNFLLVWLDERIDDVNNDEYHNDITKLRQIVNTVNTFTESCIIYLFDMTINYNSNIKNTAVQCQSIANLRFNGNILSFLHLVLVINI